MRQRRDRVLVVMFAEPAPGWVSDEAYGPLTEDEAYLLAADAATAGAVDIREYRLNLPPGRSPVAEWMRDQPFVVTPSQPPPAVQLVAVPACRRCGVVR